MKDINEVWRVKSLGIEDVDESASEFHIGTKRKKCDDNLFEILPQLLITPSVTTEELEIAGGGGVLSCLLPNRVCSAAVGGDTLGIVLDSSLLILEKTTELQLKTTVSFTAPIDFILWRRSILLIGLSSSEIVLVDPRTYEIKEKRKLNPNLSSTSKRFFVDATLHSNPDPTKVDVSVVGANGIVYIFDNICLSDGVLDSTHDQNVSVDLDVGSIKGKLRKCIDNGNIVCSASASKQIMVLGELDGTLSLHNVGDHDEELQLNQSEASNLRDALGFPSDVTMKKIITFEGLLFVLFSNGHLEIFLDFYPTSRLTLPDSSYIVHDFSLVMTGESETKLWVIYGDTMGKNFIGIFGGPSFIEAEFCSQIPRTKDWQNVQEETKFIFPTKTTPFEEPFSFMELSSHGTKVYHMSETSTDATILKLLSRGKFDDAVALATEYNKDLDVVFKAKAKAKLNDLLGAEKSKKFSERSEITFAEMVDALEKINDGEFVCNFCVQRGLPKLKWVKQLLAVGKGKVKHCMGTEAAKDLLLTLKMLFTFEQVFPEPTIQDWIQFESDENTMFLQCMWFLKKGDFEKAERVWRRHFDEFIPSISLNDFGPFFVILFRKKLASLDSVSLFRCILPYAVEKCSDDTSLMTDDVATLNGNQMKRVSILIDIVKRQLCSLERDVTWPKEAIEFSKLIIDAVKDEHENLKNSRNKNESTVIRQSTICKEILKRMLTLLQNLVELDNLKQNHSIRIPFQQYIEDNVGDVVNSMLYELFHRDEIERFMNNFLVPFAARKGLDVDLMVYEHVKSVLTDLPFHINSIDIPHEERIICVIDFVKSPYIKLECVQSVAEEWPVPWSNGIDGLVLSVLRMDVDGDPKLTSVQKTIEKLRIQVPYRCLLVKYRMTGYKVQTSCGVTMALLKIIKTGKPDEYFQDCQELIKHTGKADEEKIRFLEYSLKLADATTPVVFHSSQLSTRLLKRLLVRSLQEFRDEELHDFTPEELIHLKGICKSLANILGDKRILEFLKLQEFVPGLNNSDIVYDEQYPFCVLRNILADSSKENSAMIIQKCQMLSNATTTPLCDILITAAAYYVRPSSSIQDQDKMWNIIEKIIRRSEKSFGRSNDPIKRDLVQGAAVTVAQFLFFQAPKCSEHQLQVLHEFLSIITTFDGNDSIQDVSKTLSGFRIFCNLREQEIPLEQEFIYIYQWIFVNPGTPDQFFQCISNYGSTILKFGDKDLFQQSFGFITKEFLTRNFLSSGSEQEKIYFTKFVSKIRMIEQELLASYDQLSEPEQDQMVVKLVEDLYNDAGLCMTPYALRQRSKSRLLSKLLAGNNYSLAAQVALVFEFYSDEEAWSKILKGFISAGDSKELCKVLTDLRNVSELWMLPEFAQGWKKVAETDPKFLDLCPIPLD